MTPPDPDNMNGQRAYWANNALTCFRADTGSDKEDCLSDLLTDLMHCADRSNRDFETELTRARANYEAETQELT